MKFVKIGVVVLVTALNGFVAGWVRDPGMFVVNTVLMYTAAALLLGGYQRMTERGDS
jgi:hypothetical protein